MIPNTQEETLEAKSFDLSHCRHAADHYSIGIRFESTHLDISACSWHSHPGYRAQLNIYDMTTQDITALGHAIIKEVLKIEMEEKAK